MILLCPCFNAKFGSYPVYLASIDIAATNLSPHPALISKILKSSGDPISSLNININVLAQEGLKGFNSELAFHSSFRYSFISDLVIVDKSFGFSSHASYEDLVL